MSLRAIAKELEISPAYLSYMINGKRPWRSDLYDQYSQVVNTKIDSVNTSDVVSDTKKRARSARHLHGVQGAARSNRAAPTRTLKTAEFMPEDHPQGWFFYLSHGPK